ncbi:ABC transporter ATP-binding protein [Heyndrickxia vini]|uniref:ABC transporter ATP-binding protein n=1 Tax=Heyndrickxia vini TaxID=1476025 RepID=A0ABX7E194_9BACI|nr:ABC transporter ATP-binding protein [Heyndrickxia vini]QQZ09351.1 ABC transporter ATP-binding protein [Heyndrickxia vini]
MNAVYCNNLAKSYANAQVLKNITFTIEPNTITGIIGRNGAGKTTLLKIIAGFFRETSGEIKVFSKKPFNNLFVSANTIYIDDQMNLPASLQLIEILEEGRRFYKNWDHQLALRLFDYFSLHPNQYYSNLSRGMRNTFNMIIGLSSHCALTIFDEPTTGMDAAVRKDFYRALLKDYIAHPRTILLSSHHLDEIEDLLEDVLLIKDGKVLLHRPISEFKEWAIGLKGPKSLIEQWIENNDVLHVQEVGNNSLYAVIKNDFTSFDIDNIRLAGIEITPVTASDVCVYLTSTFKGGIDDVFN